MNDNKLQFDGLLATYSKKKPGKYNIFVKYTYHFYNALKCGLKKNFHDVAAIIHDFLSFRIVH